VRPYRDTDSAAALRRHAFDMSQVLVDRHREQGLL
jgi:hypothetical protein